MGIKKRSSHTIAAAPEANTVNDTFYPLEWARPEGMPTHDKFEVLTLGSVGRGIRAKVGFARGQTVTRFTGQLMSDVLQHTLQVSQTSHVHDPYFIGLLTHSCAPNCLLDMSRLEIQALTNIPPGETLTIDYALTEDTLYRQFPCDCGAANCRHWITGRTERVNAEGHNHLANLTAPLP